MARKITVKALGIYTMYHYFASQAYDKYRRFIKYTATTIKKERKEKLQMLLLEARDNYRKFKRELQEFLNKW